MTSERDFDRLARAWLELGPDEAPDRVVAAVLQAVEDTPQVRRPLRWPTWRSFKMNRISQAAGLAAVLVVVIGGGILLSQRNQPAAGGPPASPSVTPAATGTSLPTSTPTQTPGGTAPSSVTPVALRTFPVSPPDAQGERSCDAIGVDDPVVGILDGDATLLEDPVWLRAQDGSKSSIVWPAGFTARFTPTVVLYDDRGAIVARAGDTISLQQSRSTAAGSFDDPYYASGMLLQKCYPRDLSTGSNGSNEPAMIELQRAPTNLGCDAIDPGYRSATIHIDPESAIVLEVNNPAYDGTKDKVNVDVWAEIDTAGGAEPQKVGTRLAVYWTAGFNATDGTTPVIHGPRGEEVARDGTRIDGEFTKLTGYSVCSSRDAVYILEYVPG